MDAGCLIVMIENTSVSLTLADLLQSTPRVVVNARNVGSLEHFTNYDWCSLCLRYFQFWPQESQGSAEALFDQAYQFLFSDENIRRRAGYFMQKEKQPYFYLCAIESHTNESFANNNIEAALDYAERYAKIYLSTGHWILAKIYSEIFANLEKYTPEQIDPVLEKLKIIDFDTMPYQLLVKLKIHLALAVRLYDYSNPEITHPVTRADHENILKPFQEANITLKEGDKANIKAEIEQIFTSIIQFEAPIMHVSIASLSQSVVLCSMK